MFKESLPNTKINSLFPQKTPKFNMTKVVVIFYNVLQFFSGLDFGFYHSYSPKVKKCLKVKSFVVCVAFAVACGSQPTKTLSHVNTWFIVFILKYVTFFLFLLSLKTSSNFCSFLQTVRSIDTKYNLEWASYKSEVKVLCINLFCFVLSVSVLVAFWEFNQEPGKSVVVKAIEIIVLSSLDILIMSYASIFFIIESRFKILVSSIESSDSDFINLQFIYKTYVDIVCKYKKAFDPVVCKFYYRYF